MASCIQLNQAMKRGVYEPTGTEEYAVYGWA